ncbi:MAG: hypothetical protein P0Y56_06585 [Candidatus Andeanibacterium colombiense]|uniref:Uncharacterized protein n=1 Tax=Candidatus Andeanibacterium colombiense TaxID=3121345 RepID=A0AAJ5XBU8_9SPHN|nr:MAG: hypothetical protein P0Y56_06585 [Sphingomonadaceae bacterium]
MKKSTRALLGMVVLDLLLAFGALWLVMRIRSGATATSVPPAEAISTITTTVGAAIGVVTGVLLFAWGFWRKREG